MDKLLCIPEFADLMSSHMDLDTLASCVRVCKAWHKIYIPPLWHTFGTFPHQPVRFGECEPPDIELSGNTKFPLYVSSNNQSDDPSDTLVPVFSMARPEIYRHSAIWERSQRATKTVWDRLFAGMPPRPGDEETIAPIVAKHAKRIRCLVVRSQWTFNACKHVCRQLTKLYFDMPSRGIPRSMSDADVLAFVECQSNLQSIYSPQFSATFKDSLLQLNREWLHFDVMLSDKDFSNIHLLLPHTRTARVELLDEGFDTEIFRLSRPHVNLRELVLRMDHFDHHMLKDILQSFPNLRRLTVEAKYGDPSCGTWRTIWLDLFLDNGYSMLVVEESPAWDIVRLIPLLPNLLVYEGYGCTFPIFDILAQYCPRLMHCRHEEMPDYSVPFVPVLHATNGQNFYAIQTSPEKSIVQVLASCRDLVSAYSFPWSISLADLTSAPWVCHKLKYLHCVFDEVPLLSDAEQEVYRSLLERRRERRAANQQYSQFDSEWMSEDERAVDRKAESLKTYIEAIEEQLQRVPDIDLKPHRIGDPIPGIDSFLGQMEAAKASIGL